MLKHLRRALLAGAALAATAAAAHGQELVVGVQNMAPWLDPGRDFSNVGSQHYFNSFDPLIGKDHTKAESVWTPTGVAVSWKQVSPTVMELKIRQGVKFHNGAVMTVDDVVFSLDRIINFTFPPYGIRKRDTLPNIVKVEAVDTDTIRITAEKPEPLFETLLNAQQTMIVPKAYVMSLSGDPAKLEDSDYEAFALKPVGTGPYKITEFVPNQRIVYERFDDFWGDKAPLQKVTVRRIPELTGRITALKNGEVDIITNVPPDQIKVISDDAKLKVESGVTPLFHVVIFNTNHPKMTPKIRQALSLAIDRKTMNEALWGGKAVVPNSHTYPQFGPLYMPELNTFEYNPDKAKQLLKEAGYDGFELRYDTGSAYYTNALLAAQAIQEMWAAVGVKMRINVDEAWTGNKPEMMTRNWSNPMYYPDPAGSFGTMWSPTGNAVSEGRWNPDETFKKSWETFRYSTDLAVRKTAYGELMTYIKNDPPVFVLWQPYESYGLKKGLNWKPQPGHIPYVLDFRAGRVSLAAN
jgi:peptide/nickel transport system substrate-binding protein